MAHSSRHSDSTARTSATQQAAALDTQQTREAHRVTLIGAVLDTLLGVAKVMVGVWVGSSALIADGVHSFSDLVTDGFVLAAMHYGRQAPDSNHPYGHGRIETLATLLLGSVLIFVAGAIAWDSVSRLLEGTPISRPGPWAIALTVVALLGKEWIFRFTLRVAQRIGSKLLAANAWHSRSDALSTVVVLIGLLGAQFGLGWLDTVAALTVGVLVGKIGWELLWEASQELVDTALPEQRQQAMRDTVLGVPGVEGLHCLRTRTVGGSVMLDLHLLVAPRLSVSEAHEIGNEVCRRLRLKHDDLSDIIFHIDPEDDSQLGDATTLPALPLRADVETQLEARWNVLPAWRRRLALELHYLDNRIDASLYIPEEIDYAPLSDIARELRQRAHDLDWLGELRIWKGPARQLH
ncbi:cation diffusion facilitator family transporter [Halomonas shantousis]